MLINGLIIGAINFDSPNISIQSQDKMLFITIPVTEYDAYVFKRAFHILRISLSTIGLTNPY